ncbi:MAG TPA: hypothetical protein VFB45_19355 [Pseudolabrys sp.]|nr:hypothetical protein [Pseudolabrys sp.]
MLKLLVTTAAAAALFATCALFSPRAEAMPIAAPGGLSAAIHNDNLAQNVAYICRRVWRCGPWGCGWRRACYFTGGYYGYGYYGRPYWGWRHRHWW